MREGRSPHGERGLKYNDEPRITPRDVSLSSWRAWIEIPNGLMGGGFTVASLSSWRAWIEIKPQHRRSRHSWSRSPHGERGLKWTRRPICRIEHRSLSSWRAWIEIRTRAVIQRPVIQGRSPHGERGLKCNVRDSYRTATRRSPHGERGLK